MVSNRKIEEITADGLAVAAATLAIESEYLEKRQDLFDVFWEFFDILAHQQAEKVQEARDRAQTFSL